MDDRDHAHRGSRLARLARFPHEQEGDPVGSAMLAFEKQNSLNVFSSRFEIVAESENAQGVLGIDLLKSRQAAIIPATVTYRLDLTNMDRDAFKWDAASETLDVVLPTLRISRPNLDEAQARVFHRGQLGHRERSAQPVQQQLAAGRAQGGDFAEPASARACPQAPPRTRCARTWRFRCRSRDTRTPRSRCGSKANKRGPDVPPV